MSKLWHIKWDESLLTHYGPIDKAHIEIVELTNQMYDLFTERGMQEEELEILRINLEKIFLDHLKLEEELYEKYDISTKDKQYEDHAKFRVFIEEADNIQGSTLVKSVLLAQSIGLYFINHLFKADKVSIQELKDKQAI
jgi:hemerythrin-like metal-binding protein